MDVKAFGDAMSTLPMKITIWASMFPFPQFIFGAASLVLKGPGSIGAMFFYVRAQSFVVAGQMHKRMPYSKLMAPVMHLPFFILVPYSIHWLFTTPSPESGVDKFHYGWVMYTTIITAISCVLDAIVAVKWMLGLKVGRYDDYRRKQE